MNKYWLRVNYKNGCSDEKEAINYKIYDDMITYTYYSEEMKDIVAGRFKFNMNIKVEYVEIYQDGRCIEIYDVMKGEII